MEWLQLPHWLMIARTLLVIAGLIGLVMSRRKQPKVQDDPAARPKSRPASPTATGPGSARLPATKESALTLIGLKAKK
jgi:hypothetical protein